MQPFTLRKSELLGEIDQNEIIGLVKGRINLGNDTVITEAYIYQRLKKSLLVVVDYSGHVSPLAYIKLEVVSMMI